MPLEGGTRLKDLYFVKVLLDFDSHTINLFTKKHSYLKIEVFLVTRLIELLLIVLLENRVCIIECSIR